MRVVFMGTPDYATIILKEMINEGYIEKPFRGVIKIKKIK